MPQQALDNPSTTKATLQDPCQKRTIVFGDSDSEQSLRTSLRRFDASSATVWGARMQFAAVFVRSRADQYRSNLLPIQAAMYHPPDDGVDGASEPSAVGRLPPLPPVPLFVARHFANAGCDTASSPS